MNVTRVRTLQRPEWRRGTYGYGTQVETCRVRIVRINLGVEKGPQTSQLYQALAMLLAKVVSTEAALVGRHTRLSVEGEERWERWELRAVPFSRCGVFRQTGLQGMGGERQGLRSTQRAELCIAPGGGGGGAPFHARIKPPARLQAAKNCIG